MNRLLADTLEILQPAIALGIIITCAYIGYTLPGNDPATWWKGAIFGGLMGSLAAIIICGLIANISLIEDHMRVMADDVEEMRARDEFRAEQEAREEA